MSGAQVQVVPCLLFQGRAAEAAMAYAGIFPGGTAEAQTEGGTEIWVVHLGGLTLRLFDSPVAQSFDFTPAMSMFVTCETAAEVERLAEALALGGKILMPVGEYPFSPCYGWVNDRYNVSWQISTAQ